MKNKRSVFSDDLDAWVKSKHPNTIASLTDTFAEKSFAVVLLLLLIIPALPIPTGGITHVFEIIAMLLSLEMIAGLKTIWLPKKWKNLGIGSLMEKKAIPMLLKRIRWFEKRSSGRWQGIFHNPLLPRFIGLLTLGFTIMAFIAPPFSGLDTLPALGVVLISLAVILEDALILLGGVVVGVAGTILTIGFGAVIIKYFKHLF